MYFFLLCARDVFSVLQQFWNDAAPQGGGIRGAWPRRDEPEQQLSVPLSYDIVDVPNAPRRNCTGSGANCIPKCFAEKGNRGPPGMPGQTGPKGVCGMDEYNRFDTK